MNVIALLFARGGSKRLPRKHLMHIGDMPVIGHAIRYALKSTDAVYVSTDCPEISAASASFGATVIQWPASLAQDNSPLTAALFHAVDELRELPWMVLVSLEGGTIIVRPGLIEHSLAMLEAQQADYTTTIFPCADKHPDWAVSMDAEGCIQPLTHVMANSQENRRMVAFKRVRRNADANRFRAIHPKFEATGGVRSKDHRRRDSRIGR